MEEASAEIDTRDISGYVINEFAICEGATSTRGEFEGTIVYSGDKAAAEENSGGSRAIERMMRT
jgi:hypothetical protein